MSNFLAIAAVTEVLRQVLHAAVSEDVTGAVATAVRPTPGGSLPDTGVNVFLYQVTPNTAGRNTDLPTRDSEGAAVQRPRAALDLHYVLSFYGNESELKPQRVMGSVVRALHSQPVLTRQLIRDGIKGGYLDAADLANDIDLVKFTPSAFTLDELSKLWSVFFQTPYVLSIAYQASVVFIEARQPARSALPVLVRGVTAEPDLSPGGPGLESLLFPNRQVGIRTGEVLTLTGRQLAGSAVSARLTYLRGGERYTFAAESGGSSVQFSIRVASPILVPPERHLPVGVYTIAAAIRPEGGTASVVTNELPLVLVPSIVGISAGAPVGDKTTIAVHCSPDVHRGQDVTLTLGDQAVPAAPFGVEHTGALAFTFKSLAPGDHWVRLRVDGIDSLLIDRSTDPPTFDPSQKVTIGA